MATREQLVNKIDNLRPLEKNCDPSFPWHVLHAATFTYVSFIDGKIDLGERAKLISNIDDITRSYKTNCICSKL